MNLIVERSPREIIEFIEEFYAIEVMDIRSTEKGLDNSVYFIIDNKNNKFVFKIVETKSSKKIKEAILLSSKLSDFFKIKYIKSKRNKIVESFISIDRPVFLYEFRYADKIHFNEIHNISLASEFIRCFHDCYKISHDMNEFILELNKDYKTYYSDSVINAIESDFRSFDKVREVTDYIPEVFKLLSDKVLNKKIFKGVTHGDFTPENILYKNGFLEFIDADAISGFNWQILDLLQFCCKTEIASDQNSLELFLKSYNICEFDEIAISIFKDLCFIFSVNCMLSTFYYTYKVEKLSVSWIKHNGLYVLENLYNNIIFLYENHFNK